MPLSTLLRKLKGSPPHETFRSSSISINHIVRTHLKSLTSLFFAIQFQISLNIDITTQKIESIFPVRIMNILNFKTRVSHGNGGVEAPYVNQISGAVESEIRGLFAGNIEL